MQLNEIIDERIQAIKKCISMTYEEEQYLRVILKGLFYEGGAFTAKLIKSGDYFCTHCEKKYSDKANIESLKNTSMCTHCDHVLGETLRN